MPGLTPIIDGCPITVPGWQGAGRLGRGCCWSRPLRRGPPYGIVHAGPRIFRCDGLQQQAHRVHRRRAAGAGAAATANTALADGAGLRAGTGAQATAAAATAGRQGAAHDGPSTPVWSVLRVDWGRVSRILVARRSTARQRSARAGQDAPIRQYSADFACTRARRRRRSAANAQRRSRRGVDRPPPQPPKLPSRVPIELRCQMNEAPAAVVPFWAAGVAGPRGVR